ncbi:uncharacterized protein LOC107042145 [Diachasma alloeum]|uniref:uncharacterized protein LOC107042145 n=1 Tax=Diachasma alloeum TaxID=454923 RepID=UPI0007382D20|nr:uncharacterized protein LOC107042145 [Diachasma alloeum]
MGSGTSSKPSNSDAIDVALAEFFFGCNVSFNVVESDLFRRFVKILNPSYKCPSRKKLATKLLDTIHVRVIEKMRYPEPMEGVLLIDGWKNSSANTKNVVCTIQTHDGNSIFLYSWDFSELRETGDELARVIDEAVAMAKEKFNVLIHAVVSDNASAMMRMGRLVEVWHSTCSSHSGNLFLKSLVDSKFAESINKLLREFKTPRAERELKKRKGSRIMLACETRWCSYRDTFRCCLRNLDLMRQLVDEQIVILKNINAELLNDSTLADKLQDYIVLFDLVCELVNKCQASDCKIADAAEYWLSLNVPVDDAKVDATLDARLDKVLQPIALVANFLHPKYQGQKFAHLEVFNAKVIEFRNTELGVENPEELEAVKKFQNKEKPFEAIFNKNVECAKTFWCFIKPYYPALAQLAIKLSNIPSSSAQIERLFSHWAFIHSDLRNRLSVERSMKLVGIYYAFKMQDAIGNYYWDEE